MIKKKELVGQWYLSDLPGEYSVSYAGRDYMFRLSFDGKVTVAVFDFAKKVRYLIVFGGGMYRGNVLPLVESVDAYTQADASNANWMNLKDKQDMIEIVKELASRRKAPFPDQQMDHWRKMRDVLDDLDLYNAGEPAS